MLLTAAPQEKFLRLRIAKEAQRLVLFQDAVDGMTHAVLILARFGFNGEGDRRFGQLHRRIFDGGVLVRQSIAGKGVFQLGHSADIACVQICNRC